MKKLLLTLVCISSMLNLGAQCSTSSAPTNNCASFGDVTDAFTLNAIAASVSGCSANGYGSFNAPVWSLTIGNTNTFVAGLGGGTEPQGFAIWIDLNNDGNYASTEMVWSSPSAGVTQTGSFVIPYSSTVANGVRMRTRNAYNTTIYGTDVCTNGLATWGETQDFFVNIICPANGPTISTASTNTYICLGQSTTFTASGASNFTWTGGSTATVVSFTPNITTSYTLIGSVGACPGATSSIVKTISVTNVPLAVSASSSPTIVCSGGAALLTGLGATNYTWLPNGTPGQTLTVSPQSTTIYTLLGYNGSGCPGASTVNLAVNPVPTVMASASSSNICSGQSVTLTATGGAIYSWQGSSSSSSMIVITPTAPISVAVTGSNSFGCSTTAYAIVLVSAAPQVAVVANQTLVCANSTVQLTASGAMTYTWANGPINFEYIATPSVNTIYTVTGSSTTTPCDATTLIAISVIPSSVVITPSVTSICPGGTATLTASGADMFNWTNGANSAQINVSPSVPLTLTVTGQVTVDGVTCNNDAVATVNLYAAPAVSVTAPRTTMCVKETNTLSATGGVSYFWSNSSITTNENVINPIVPTTLNVTVTGTDANGCTNTSSIQIKINSCNGLADFTEHQQISIYPNPASTEMTIVSENAVRLSMVNQLGQTVRIIEAGPTTTVVPVTDLPAGVYIITGQHGNHTIHQQVIISR